MEKMTALSWSLYSLQHYDNAQHWEAQKMVRQQGTVDPTFVETELQPTRHKQKAWLCLFQNHPDSICCPLICKMPHLHVLYIPEYIP